MSSVLHLFLLLATTMLASALLAYPVYQYAGDVLNFPFNKVLSRLLVLNGLIFSIVFLFLHKVYSKEALGFKPSGTKGFKLIRNGFVIGFAIVLLLELALLALDIHGFDKQADLSSHALFKLLLKATISGLLVGLIEEIIFRGAVFSILLKKLNIVWTSIISSLFYSAVHFIKVPEIKVENPNWLSGIELLPNSMNSLFQTNMFDMFITLFVLGLLFSIMRLLTGNIYLCMGVHAGIVFINKLVKYFTNHTPGSDYNFLVNNVNHQMGHLATLWLVIFVGLYLYLYKIRAGRKL